MIRQNTVCFRIWVSYGNISPAKFYKETKPKPKTYVQTMAIPQTAGDQVWIWTEFRNIFDKAIYVCGLTEDQKKNIATDFTQKDLDYWCKDDDFRIN